MSSVHFPVRVAALFRRVVQAVSSLSVSNQQLLKDSSVSDEPKQDSSWRSWWSSEERWYWHLTQVDPNAWFAFNLSSLTEVSSTYSSGLGTFPPSPGDIPPRESSDTIHRLIQNPALYNPLRTPRYPIVLCHGLYGFDERGPSSFPSMRMQYWSNVLRTLRQTVGADVIVTTVPSTGSVTSRAASLDRQLNDKARGRGINFLAHSMGGLDCRHLITHVKPTEYTPLSLTTVSTPHRGSPFMDWCAENIGLGRLIRREGERLAKSATHSELPPDQNEKPKSDLTPFSLSSLPSSFTTLLISILDSPAYANLTSTYLNTVFNPNTPNDPSVKYFSVAGRMPNASVWHPFWLPKMVLDGVETKERDRLREAGHPLWAHDEEWGNDGLVTIQSAKWGEFLGVMEGVDHWEIRGARGLEFNVDFGEKRDWSWLAGAWKKDKADKHAAAVMDDDVIKASTDKLSAVQRALDTDKLSAVFDWVIDQVPTPSPLIKGKSKDIEVKQSDKKHVKPRHDLETKADLDRFYVALSRKLYDEGL
ncbi:alpha/beta-hydrolase [Hymenopellis radicata]|nr:alpha/beta-hydrolase [Hymenopellis radicata]